MFSSPATVQTSGVSRPLDWGIYQPTKQVIFDYSGVNEHSVPETGRNAVFGDMTLAGDEEVTFTDSQVFNVEDFGVASVPADIGCNFRTTVRGAGVHSQTLTLADSSSNILWSTEDGKCSSDSMYLDSGESYTLQFTSTSNNLGLLGFFAVIIVIIFCGFFLRYGFSQNYKGRSNLLRLRIKHERRGDQI